MLADLMGKPLTGVISFPTVRDPKAARRAAGRPHQGAPRRAPRRRRLRGHRRRRARHGRALDDARAACADAGLARRRPARAAGRRHRPARPDRELRPRLRAGADVGASQPATAQSQGDLVFVSVSDGVGVGVVMNGEVLRGRHNIAGEFGHVPLSLDGPRCSCGSNGCWEAYVANPATLARYFGRPMSTGPQDVKRPPVHRRGPRGPRARRRRQGHRRHRGHGALPRPGHWPR